MLRFMAEDIQITPSHCGMGSCDKRSQNKSVERRIVVGSVVIRCVLLTGSFADSEKSEVC